MPHFAAPPDPLPQAAHRGGRESARYRHAPMRFCPERRSWLKAWLVSRRRSVALAQWPLELNAISDIALTLRPDTMLAVAA
jgi:hypothetical protein